MNTTTLAVDGMTCEHCVRAVTTELSLVPGVAAVTVDLHSGGTSVVTVTTDGVVPADRLAEAIDEAGYSLTA